MVEGIKSVCSRCGGHRWLVWLRIQARYHKEPQMKPCEKCNPEGKVDPPEYDGGIT